MNPPEPGSLEKQLSLFSEEEESRMMPKEPHQMSPNEFRDHPMTVFHSSYQRIPKPGNRVRSGFSGIHAGSESSAIGRARTNEGYIPREAEWDYRGDAPWESGVEPLRDRGFKRDQGRRADHGPASDAPKQVLHAINIMRYVTPESRLHKPAEDWDANDKKVVKKLTHPLAYTNEFEDSGSMSVVIPNPMRGPLTHSQYVTEAIREGRGHEVHPETMWLYNKGVLDNYEKVPEKETRSSDQLSLYPHRINFRNPMNSKQDVPITDEEYDRFTGLANGSGEEGAKNANEEVKKYFGLESVPHGYSTKHRDEMERYAPKSLYHGSQGRGDLHKLVSDKERLENVLQAGEKIRKMRQQGR